MTTSEWFDYSGNSTEWIVKIYAQYSGAMALGSGNPVFGRIRDSAAAELAKRGVPVTSETKQSPSADELAACEMARAMIFECATWMWGMLETDDCSQCASFTEKTCPARRYLERCGQADAWEVAK